MQILGIGARAIDSQDFLFNESMLDVILYSRALQISSSICFLTFWGNSRRTTQNFLNKYLACRAELGLVVLVIDSRLEAQEADLEVLHALKTLGLRYLVVATKVDKLSQNERQGNSVLFEKLRLGLGLPPDEEPLPFSSTDVGRLGSKTICVRDVWGHVKAAILEMAEGREAKEHREGKPRETRGKE